MVLHHTLSYWVVEVRTALAQHKERVVLMYLLYVAAPPVLELYSGFHDIKYWRVNEIEVLVQQD